MPTSTGERLPRSRKCRNSPYSRSSIPANLDSSVVHPRHRGTHSSARWCAVSRTCFKPWVIPCCCLTPTRNPNREQRSLRTFRAEGVAAIVLISCDTEATEYDELSKTGRPCGGVAISHSYVRSPFL